MNNAKLTFLALILFFTSCETDGEIDVIQDVPMLTQVSELITVNGEPTTDFGEPGAVTYEYNSNGFVSRFIATDHAIDYIYNDQNQLVSEITTNEDGSSFEITFTYENDLIIREDRPFNIVTYSYNENNQLSEISNNNPPSSGSLIYDANGNVIRTIFTSDDGTEEIIENFEYDDRINPISLLFPSAFNQIKRVSNNNITFRDNSCGIRQITYEYNEFDLPIESTSTVSCVAGLTFEREFTYN